MSYTTLTVQFIDDSWNLTTRVLFTCAFPDERKSGINIEKELLRRFVHLGLLSEQFKKLRFVTDRGSNIIKALESYTRYSCIFHVLNTVLGHIFRGEILQKNCPGIYYTLTSCKTLVTFMKQSGYLKLLTKTLHQQVETRWCSHYEMLNSIYCQLSDIEEILDEKGESFRIGDIKKEKLQELLDFLEPFVLASRQLEADKTPPIHLVLPYFYKLAKYCDSSNEIFSECFFLNQEHWSI